MAFPTARFPGAVWSPITGCPGLTWADSTDQRRLVLHSTEGASIGGAESAYRANKSAPHLTVDMARRVIHQHVGMDNAAYSLRNGPAPMQTNRDRYTWQVELVGFAERMADLPAGQLEWLAENVLRPFLRVYGVPPVALDFHPYPPPVRLGSEPWRLDQAAWVKYSGILGHQHVGDGNFHGDPGALNVPKALAIARGAVPTTQQKEALMALSDADQLRLFANVEKALVASREARLLAGHAYGYAKAGALAGLDGTVPADAEMIKAIKIAAAEYDPTND